LGISQDTRLVTRNGVSECCGASDGWRGYTVLLGDDIGCLGVIILITRKVSIRSPALRLLQPLVFPPFNAIILMGLNAAIGIPFRRTLCLLQPLVFPADQSIILIT
jgi:hypothetical protein